MRILLFICFSSLSLFAQPLRLDEALELIKKQNLEVQAAQYEVQSSELSYDMAYAQNFGQLNFTQNIMRSNDAGNVFGFKLTSREATFGDFGFSDFLSPPPGTTDILQVQPDDLNYPDDRNFFQSKLTYELPLYTGNKISAYENMANEMRHISILDKKDQINAKMYETRKSYFDMALLEASLKNLKIIRHNIQKLENMTKEMILEGYAKKVDLLEVQSKKANVERIIVELEGNEELLYHYLSFLLNQEVRQIEVPNYDLIEPSISAKEILENNIDIQKTLSALKIRENMLISEESRYLPTIGAMAEVQTADNTFLGEASEHKSYTVGLQLKWNIFNGGADSAAIEQARVQSLKIKTQSQLARQGISLKIKEVQTKIKVANAKITNLEVELSLAKQIYENYEDRYKEQLSSMNDVIIKQSSWLEKILELLQAKNTRNTQIFALERLGSLHSGETL